MSAPGTLLPVWGVYRELDHSPGREEDDALILRAVATHLEGHGFSVSLRSTEQIGGGAEEPPPLLFVMCMRSEMLRTLERWQERGSCILNRPEAIRNTYRDRMATLFERARIPFPPSVLVSTASPGAAGVGLSGRWIKRGDVHRTDPGDVVRAADEAGGLAALRSLSQRGIALGLLQQHVDGDLVKFYGVRGVEDDPPGWFEWFYHRDQDLKRHPFDEAFLAATARKAAETIGVDIWGGDAIVTPSGEVFIIDLNAWPSFALYRETAAPRIAALLASRFRNHGRGATTA